MAADKPAVSQPKAHATWAMLCMVLALAGAGLLAFSLLPYPQARSLADLLTRDGSLEFLSSQRFASLLLPLRIGALILLAIAAGLLATRRRSQALLLGLPGLVKIWTHRWVLDIRSALAEVRTRLLRRGMLLPMLGLTLLAVLARLWFVQVPLEHDEAYTFSVFAVQPLRMGLIDYHFPNNHLFHTLLVHLAYRLFGPHIWAIRLPALVAGILLAPAGYLLARRLYDRHSGLLTGAAIAAAPVLIDYSVNARGYTLLALFTILALILAVELARRENQAWWGLLALVGCLGLYTVPVFVYSLALVYGWLGLAWLTGRLGPGQSRSRLLGGMVASGFAALGLAGLLYLPVFLNNGLAAVFSNPWVAPLEWSAFGPTVLSRADETWAEWTRDISPMVIGLALLGLTSGLAFHTRISRVRIPLQAGLLILPLLVLIQRPNPWSKIWLFLVPLLLVWAAGGLIGPLRRLAADGRLRPAAVPFTLAALVTVLAFACLHHTLRYHPGLHTASGPLEQAVQAIDASYQPGQIVVITAPDEAALWAYFYTYDLPREALRRDRPFDSAYVLVNREHNQSLESVIRERGPDPGFFDPSSSRILTAYDTFDLYLVQADRQAVRSAYGQEDQP